MTAYSFSEIVYSWEKEHAQPGADIHADKQFSTQKGGELVLEDHEKITEKTISYGLIWDMHNFWKEPHWLFFMTEKNPNNIKNMEKFWHR